MLSEVRQEQRALRQLHPMLPGAPRGDCFCGSRFPGSRWQGLDLVPLGVSRPGRGLWKIVGPPPQVGLLWSKTRRASEIEGEGECDQQDYQS